MPEYNLGTAQGQIRITTDTSGVTETEKALAGLGAETVRARDANGRFVASNKEGQDSLAKTKVSASTAATALKGVGTVVGVAGAAVVSGLTYAVKTAADFQQGLSNVQAVSGATAGQMDQVRAAALRIGEQTSFSSRQAVDAISELVKAGVSVHDVLGGAADATVALAAAGEVSLPEAATIASNAMNQFGLKARELPEVANLIAGAANASAIDVGQFGNSIAQSGAVAHLAGLSFHDTTVAIAELGNAGIVGSDAGTSLKTALQSLVPSTKAAYEEMSSLGLAGFDTARATQYLRDRGVTPTSKSFVDLSQQIRQTIADQLGLKVNSADVTTEYNRLTTSAGITSSAFYDQSGNLKSLGDIQQTLRTALQGMTADQKQLALQTIFGSDAIRAAAVFADQGSKGYDKLSTAIGKVSAADVAKTRLNNLQGALQNLQGSVELVAINVGSVLLPALNSLTQFATTVVNAIAGLPAGFQTFIAVGALVAGVVATLVGGLALLAAAAIPVVGAVVAAAPAALAFATAAAPIVGVVAGIVAALVGLGTGLTLFLTQTDAGRAVIAGFVSYVQTSFQNLAAAVGGVIAFFQTNVVPVIASVVQQVSVVFGTLGSIIGAAFAQIQAVVQPAVDFLVQTFGGTLPGILQIVGVAFGVLAGIIGIVLLTPIAVVTAAVIALVAVFAGIITVIANVVSFVQGAIPAVGAVFAAVFGGIGAVVSGAIGAVVGTVQAGIGFVQGVVTAGLAAVQGVFTTVWGVIGPTVTSAMTSVRSIVSSVITIVTALVQAGLFAVRTVFSTVFNALVGIVTPPLNTARAAVSAAVTGIQSVVSSVFGAVRAFVASVFAAIQSAISGPINTARGVVQSAVSAIQSAVSSAFNSAKSTVSSIMSSISSAVSSGIDRVTGFFSGLSGKITGALSGIAGAAFSAGASIVGHLVSGLLSGLAAIANAAAKVAQAVKNALPHSPAKTGPFSGSGWTDVLESGKAIVTQFGSGFGAALPSLMRQVHTVTGAVQSAVASTAGSLPTLGMTGIGPVVNTAGLGGTAASLGAAGYAGGNVVGGATNTVNYNDYSRGDGTISDEDRLRRALVRTRPILAVR